MISRTLLLIALCCALATSLTPLATNEDDDCALYLTGPGRSSAYDYNLNLLKGNFAYDGQHTCITYEAVNQAYLDARTRILVSQPKGDWGPEDFASVGELILDISISLARTYGLNYEEIEKGLPLIDTSRTLIREVCPPVFSHVECRAGKYRRLDGLCNNLKNPTWGATMAPFQRLIGPLFADGINAPRISHTGRDLPLSRVVSRTMHPDEGFHDHAGTVMVIAWGQFMDHDYTLTGTPLDPTNRNDPEECCKRPPHLKHPYCNEIRVPDDDYFYRLFGVKCIDFVRGFPSPRPGCRLGSRAPFNTLTGAIDGNTVYGVTDKFARKLRTGYSGLLRMNPVFKEYGLKDLLPLKLDIPDEGCTRPNKNMYCFEAGEIRVNEQLVLTVMHTLMAREHNRVAEALAAVNPHWDDETLFQEARRINIAEIQHITYNEFLPILLGKDVMEKFGLVLEKEGYWNGYDTAVNPDVIAGFAAAAYRFGHSLLPTAVERWSKAHKFIASKRLSDLIRRPFDLYRAGVLDEYVMGLMNQVAQAMDDSITQEVTNHLFKKVGARFGMDLVSFNMQRGREFGLPGYMEFRKFCGLSGADSFQDLSGSMANETVRRYETIFEHPVDVDLWSGGVSERPLPGSMLGPTFACVIATQFSYSRRGDRFWFELPNQPSSFTPEQLREIRKSRLARVICDNTDIIDTVQLYPMVLPDHELNPRVPCRSGIIPAMDFSKWAEPAPFVNAAKEYMTLANIINDTSSNNQLEINCQQKNASNEKILNENTTAVTKQCDDEEVIDTPHVMPNCTVFMSENKDNTLCGNTTNDLRPVNNSLAINENHSNTDTLLKYIYKKKQNDAVQKKSSGYVRNSLLRKKRSHGTSTESEKSPANFDYTTIHNSKDTEEVVDLQRKPDIINSANLANFNIETLHVNDAITKRNQLPDNDEYRVIPSKHDSQNEGKTYSEENINEDKKQENLLSDNEDSTAYKSLGESDESNENISLSKNTSEHAKEDYNSSDSGEDTKDYPNEIINNKISGVGTSKEIDYSKTSSEKEKHRDGIKDDIVNSNQDNFSSEETSKSNDNEQYRINVSIDPKPKINTNDAVKQNDLDDFSYERIHVNGEGQVEASQHSNEDGNVSAENSTVITPDNKRRKIEEQKFTPAAFTLKSDKSQININDEEVKPVIELNNENNSEEASEEIHNVPHNGKNEKHEDLKDRKNDKSVNEKVDVKQQFERIPLNYNYVDKTSVADAPSKSDADETVSDKNDGHGGSLETLSPENHKFDENLNIKFSDISIKLPEINLPEDILDYATEGPIFEHHEKTKNRFFNYDGSQSQERSNEKADEADDDYDNDAYGYINNNHNKNNFDGNAKPKQRNDAYDDEDLYEKFVRERFGKRGSFNKRSERLKQANPVLKSKQLFHSLQNVLKKTKQIQKEADKDPKAGYLWTLEYGE